MALPLTETNTELAGLGLNLMQGPSGCLMAEGLDPRSWLTTWRQVRDAVPRTRRFPLAIDNSYGQVEDLCGDAEAERQGVAPPTDWNAAQATVESIDPWAVYDSDRRFGVDVPEGNVRYLVPHGDAELAEQALRELSPPRTQRAIARWSYDLIRDRSELASGYDFSRLVSRENWYEPEAVALVLLPTPHPWMAGLWSFYGAWEQRAHALPAAMREWHTQWGAEPVANWGTMLQLLVAAPPTGHEEAWTVAEQILTIADSNQEEIWALALALPRGNHWFLHSRP